MYGDRMKKIVLLALASLMSCGSSLCPGVSDPGFEPPKMNCTSEFAGTYVCTSGTFFHCTPNACWGSGLDGPCLPSGGDEKPAEGVKLCTAPRAVMPDVPCDASRSGNVWCSGTARWQCLPEGCWGANDGAQACTITR